MALRKARKAVVRVAKNKVAKVNRARAVRDNLVKVKRVSSQARVDRLPLCAADLPARQRLF